MKALVFRNDRPRQAATKIASFVTSKAFVGRLAPVRLEDIAEPTPPGPDWVMCDTILSGLCGSDTKQMFLDGARDNPSRRSSRFRTYSATRRWAVVATPVHEPC